MVNPIYASITTFVPNGIGKIREADLLGLDIKENLKHREGNMYKTWIIAAESSQARFFSVPSKKEPLEELPEMLNPASKIHESELTSDLPGRTVTSGLSGNKHAMEPHTSPKEHATSTFAKQIADKVEKARVQGELEQVILVCPPKFLGLLRDNLSNQAKKMVIQSLDKNLISQNESDIRKHLF